MQIPERKAKIMAAFRKNLAAFRMHTPGGDLNAEDQQNLIRCTARDAGVAITEVREEIWNA